MSQSAARSPVAVSDELELPQITKRATRVTLTLRFATDAEVAHWDDNVRVHSPGHGSFLQCSAFAKTKAQFGWRPRYLVYEGKTKKLYALALERTAPTLGTLWYITGLPINDSPESDRLVRAIVKANKAARHLVPNLFLIKLEVLLTTTKARLKLAKDLGLVKSNNIQSNASTVILDVSGPAENLFSTISERGRRCIRISQRRGVEVKKLKPGKELYRTMYELMKTVNGGKGSMMIRPYSYYDYFWTQFVEAGLGNFYGVYEDGRLVASAFVVVFGDSATYKDGGSTPNRNRSDMQSHGLQWHIIQDLNRMGIKHYDLCGSPPNDRINDTTHPFYGIGIFKTSFNKQVQDRLGTYDQPLDKLVYSAWNTYGKKIIQRVYWAAKHDLYW